MSRFIQTGLFLTLFLLVINVTVINFFVIKGYVSKPEAYATNIPSEEKSSSIVCDYFCQEKIIQDIQKSLPNSTSTVISPTESSVNSREYYISLGTGNISTKDWADIPGAEAYIDTRSYPNIKQVIFETYLSIPTANGFAYAKLYNVTDKHDVWLSEVSMETNNITRREQKITLEPGNKLYRVMMKSSMGYEAVLHNARIKIITN